MKKLLTGMNTKTQKKLAKLVKLATILTSAWSWLSILECILVAIFGTDSISSLNMLVMIFRTLDIMLAGFMF